MRRRRKPRVKSSGIIKSGKGGCRPTSPARMVELTSANEHPRTMREYRNRRDVYREPGVPLQAAWERARRENALSCGRRLVVRGVRGYGVNTRECGWKRRRAIAWWCVNIPAVTGGNWRQRSIQRLSRWYGSPTTPRPGKRRSSADTQKCSFENCALRLKICFLFRFLWLIIRIENILTRRCGEAAFQKSILEVGT